MPFIDLNESQDRRLQMLLQTAQAIQQNKIAREELNIKRQQLDPAYQARQLANTLAMVNPEAATKLFGGAGGGVSLPSQQIPDYMNLEQPLNVPRVNSQSVGLGRSGILGANVKMGGTTFRVGQPGMSEIDKANLDIHKGIVSKGLEQQQKMAQGAEQTTGGLGLYLDQFKRSYQELKKFDPEIDKEGTSGWFSRRGADVANYFDELPETAALKSMAAPFAQEIATMIEGRATDQDRDIQRKAFADVLQGPSTKNIRLASNSLVNLYRKGAKIDRILGALESSDVDIMNKIANQVYESHPELKQEKSKTNLDDIFKGL